MNLLLAILILSTLAPIEAATPITTDSTVIVGTAHPGALLRLRIAQQPDVDLMTMVDSAGRFEFHVGGLVVSHVIVIMGYGTWDYSLVEPVGRRVFLPMVGK